MASSTTHAASSILRRVHQGIHEAFPLSLAALRPYRRSTSRFGAELAEFCEGKLPLLDVVFGRILDVWAIRVDTWTVKDELDLIAPDCAEFEAVVELTKSVYVDSVGAIIVKDLC
ncbi:hypothetical protein TIFTF001_039588 [Ficus carica]|uniref:Uncharacterized protein n=1 Tax=Ficus carica TaxID=3494 RepID=A0AA88E9G0_FICCA|nr:hypothetical protein TIFTF001_039564 [Ficus carica]GMN70526.1 hypothetical protein TIFTF001_039568 [Ficus carica]GMN70534.1 hypothetical protein TIFTF001_039576 [Ficus carica]GMN70547.1 hypothetical protein TIFTF001_039588 [Ficus carica]